MKTQIISDRTQSTGAGTIRGVEYNNVKFTNCRTTVFEDCEFNNCTFQNNQYVKFKQCDLNETEIIKSIS